jgi:hypothetical protein
MRQRAGIFGKLRATQQRDVFDALQRREFMSAENSVRGTP